MKVPAVLEGPGIAHQVVMISLPEPADSIAREKFSASATISGEGLIVHEVPAWLEEREIYARRPLTDLEILVLYGDGSDDPGGLIPMRKRPLGLLDKAKPFPWTPPRRRPCSSPERARTYRRDLGRFTALTSATVIPQG